MTLHAKVSGVWEEVDDPQVKVSGTWREIDEGWVKVSGVWRQFYNRVDTITLSNGNLSDTVSDPGTALCSYTVRRDGDVAFASLGSPAPGADDWVLPRNATKGDDYDVRLTLNSSIGGFFGGTVNTWLQINTDRLWSINRTSLGLAVANVTVEIRRRSDLVVVGANTFTMSAQVE